MRNLSELARSRDLDARRLALTYAKLRFRLAVRRPPARARLLDWELAYEDFLPVVHTYEEIFLRRQYPFVPRRSDPLIVDCGANIGIATLFFKTLVPAARILSFEPEPTAYRLLEENVRHNRLENVECFRLALAREPGTATLRAASPAAIDASLEFGGPGWSVTTVDTERLSTILGDREVDFLKLDVEGSEGAILTDLRDHGSLARVAELALEYHPSREGDLAELLAILSEAKFDARIAVAGDRLWEPDQVLLVHAVRRRSH
jgi:FkbM family methyltransferase